MQLAGIGCQSPTNKIINEAVIDLVKYYSNSVYRGSISDLERVVRGFLSLTGIESRYWRADSDKPIDIIHSVFETALHEAGIQKEDIDLVIYSGIDRGFVEPANANFICKTLGLQPKRNFDVVDACMGWVSALQIADALLEKENSFNHVLIVNAEFPMDKKGTILPNNFTIENLEELQWKSPSFTLGEAASACVFKRSETESLYEFIEMPEYASLCFIPLVNYDKYAELTGDDLVMRFFANGTDLLKLGMQPAIDVLQRLLKRIQYTPATIFPHSVSEKVIKTACNNAGIGVDVHSTFQQYGNLATVSIPSAIKRAYINHKINKGDKTIAWIASAGMKFAAIEIQL
jgi:3-oxoacyl-[acyl-carrier-protein] synthase III